MESNIIMTDSLLKYSLVKQCVKLIVKISMLVNRFTALVKTRYVDENSILYHSHKH